MTEITEKNPQKGNTPYNQLDEKTNNVLDINSDLIESVHTLVKEVSDLTKTYKEKIKVVDSKIKQLDTAIKQSDDYITNFKSFVSDVEKFCDDVARAVNDTMGNIPELNNKMDELHQKVDAETKSIAKITNLTETVKKDRETVTSFVTEKDKIKDELNYLSNGIEKLAIHKKELQKGYKELSNECDDIKNSETFKFMKKVCLKDENFIRLVAEYMMDNLVAYNSGLFKKELPLVRKKNK